MTTTPAPVQRWDVADIADELEDVLAQLHTGLIRGYDPLEHLKQLIARTWEASRLDADQAHKLRDERFFIEAASCDACNADPGEPCRPYCVGLAARYED